ncbi:MAG TPA: hypothetical protein VK663_06600 [Burkholderiales bacterium]|nr:hypothetical protein [Burkholderiales bacterium]
MYATFDDYRPRRDGVTIPTIVIWIVVSLLAHVAVLLWTPRLNKPSTEEPVPPPLTAYLRPAPQLAPPPQVVTPPSPVRPPPPAQPQPPKAKAPAPVIARAKPAPQPPAFTVPPQEPPSLKQTPQLTTPPPAEPDLSAYIAARKRARGEDVPSAEVENANRGALSSAALKPSSPITFGDKPPTPSGGLFQIRRRGYDYAEFMFFGWNQNFRRAVPQMIEVRKGDNSDIDIAVVRKIIEIIRDHERGDFTWYSKRSGKNLTLSARPRDNGGLEDFMMQEFYEDLHRYR